jgi:hypothetical protein
MVRSDAKTWLVGFGQPPNRRWRDIDRAESPEDAVVRALKSMRPGVVKRLARRASVMWAWVSGPRDPRHANGKPFLVHGFKLQFGGE